MCMVVLCSQKAGQVKIYGPVKGRTRKSSFAICGGENKDGFKMSIFSISTSTSCTTVSQALCHMADITICHNML